MALIARLKSPGAALSRIAPAAVLGGSIVTAGAAAFVARNEVSAGHRHGLNIGGIYEMPKDVDEVLGLWTPVYWHQVDQVATATATEYFFGYVSIAAGAGVETVDVLHHPFPPGGNPAESGDAMSAAEVQAVLDAVGYCKLPPGTHTWSETVILRSGQTLEGRGATINWAGSTGGNNNGNYALQFGEESESSYRTHLIGLSFNRSYSGATRTGGGIKILGVAQTNTIQNVWVGGAAGHGFWVAGGEGESLVLRDCQSWENAGCGFLIETNEVHNAIGLDHCNAQNNRRMGFVIRTAAENAQADECWMRDCVVQGNGRDGATQCEALIRGYVTNFSVDNCWFEAANAVSADRPKIGILIKPQVFGSTTRRPNGVEIGGNTVFAYYGPWTEERAAIVSVEGIRTTFDQMRLFHVAPILRGTLSTRTSDTAGVIALGSGHGLAQDDVVDVNWSSGRRSGVTVTAADSTTIAIGSGSGDNLPAESSAIRACEQAAGATMRWRAGSGDAGLYTPIGDKRFTHAFNSKNNPGTFDTDHLVQDAALVFDADELEGSETIFPQG